MAASETGKAGKTAGRRLVAFKALALLALLAVTAYGMFDGGLYFEEKWLPVAAGILALSLVTLFVRGYYSGVPKAGWLLIGLLGALVLVKGLSMIWTISPSLTIQELLRSAMYLATFAVALAAVSYRRQAAPIVDAICLVIAPVAGYGLLQKIYPASFPVSATSPDRIDSTLEYANTFAMVVALGIMLGLARMGSLRSPLARAVYAALLLCLCAALFFTFSRGGFAALGLGVAVFFVLCGDRLRSLANLLLLSLPALWLVYRTQDHAALYQSGAPQAEQLAAGGALLTDLLIAAAAAFVLQLAYSMVAMRRGLQSGARRALGALAVVGVVALVGVGGFAALGAVSDSGGEGATSGVQERLTSLDSLRYTYWKVGLEAWREQPLTGTGAGTFEYTWLQERPIDTGVKQIHNLYLEQGTETGIFAFAAMLGFALVLPLYIGTAALRMPGGGPGEPESGRRTLLAGLAAAIVVYLFSSVLEWHWYIPASTLIFFILAGVAVKYASFQNFEKSENFEKPGA
ncbi:hypothetical protein BH20ACT11_BH20ACT11_16410 [soil metagenome]